MLVAYINNLTSLFVWLGKFSKIVTFDALGFFAIAI
jgi:hypothetical protein